MSGKGGGGKLSRAVYLVPPIPTPTQVFDVDIFFFTITWTTLIWIVVALKSQDKPYKLVFNVRKIEKNGTWVGGNLSRAVYLTTPPPRFFMFFFSSPSFEPPWYKIKLDLKSQDESYKLSFNVGKEETTCNWYKGGG